MKPRRTVLVVDDEPFVNESLVEVVESEAGWRAVSAADADEALSCLAREAVDVVVADLQMPGGGAMTLLQSLGGDENAPPVIVITGVGTVGAAVEAMKTGAFDFVQKPIETGQLQLLIRRALEHRRLVSDVAYLREQVRAEAPVLVGQSEAMQRVRTLIQQVAPTDSTVLITGESGTGKELVAESIHRLSARADAHLVRVNCAAVPEALFESEFFGHRKGSFSGAISDRRGRFAEAEGGTLVLDEIGTLRPEMQAKLLRVLESGEYQVVGESATQVADVRVIAVSNAPLKQHVEEDRFRADLYYRLAIFPIEMPPLRERKQELGPLAAYLAAVLRGAGNAPDLADPLDDEAVDVLLAHDWPGNVRELRNVIERALILCGENLPDAGTLRAILESSVRHDPRSEGHALHLRSRLDETEKELLLAALERSGGRRKDAAALLGVDPRNLAYYLRKHGLQPDRP